MAVRFELPPRIEDEYRRSIGKLMGSIIPRKTAGMSLEQWLAKLAGLSDAVDIAVLGSSLARKMVQQVSITNARTWREASARSQRSRMLYNLLQKEMQGPVGERFRQIVADNSRYITSIPRDVSLRLSTEIAKAQQQGARSETIAKMLRVRFPEVMQSKINVIARTETSKASTALTRARSEELDLPAYIWLTSRDARVRKSHRLMNGVVVFWADPPSPEELAGERTTLGHYNSGDAPNCRCTQRVILTLDDVFRDGGTVRVYTRGSIVRMGRRQFENLSGYEPRMAA